MCTHDSHPDPLRVVLELIHNLDVSWVVLEFNTHLDPLRVVLELIHNLDLLRVIINLIHIYTRSQVVLELNTNLDPVSGRSRILYTSRPILRSF